MNEMFLPTFLINIADRFCWERLRESSGLVVAADREHDRGVEDDEVALRHHRPDHGSSADK
jgi:hypothetical protein